MYDSGPNRSCHLRSCYFIVGSDEVHGLEFEDARISWIIRRSLEEGPKRWQCHYETIRS